MQTMKGVFISLHFLHLTDYTLNTALCHTTSSYCTNVPNYCMNIVGTCIIFHSNISCGDTFVGKYLRVSYPAWMAQLPLK